MDFFERGVSKTIILLLHDKQGLLVKLNLDPQTLKNNNNNNQFTIYI